MEKNQEQNKNKLFIYLLVVFFAVFIGSGIFLLVSNKPGVQNENQQTSTTSTVQQEKMISPTTMPTAGSLELTMENPESTIEKNIDINVVANSAGENISAYDVLVTYDPLAFDFIKVVSLNANFQVYSYKRGNRLTLTTIKTSQDQTPSIFKDEPVVKLTFKPKKIGQYLFEILPSYDKETTKLVNDKTEVIKPKINKIEVNVGNK
jgi:hypothetical protein